MSYGEELEKALRADAEKVEAFEADPENVRTLRALLSQGRRNRPDADTRAEIAQRIIAAGRQQRRKDHPGSTRRERLFPWAFPVPPPVERESAEEQLVEMGIGRPVAAYLAGTTDRLSAEQYRVSMLPVVRRIRSAIERGELERSVQIEDEMRVVLNPYWQRAFARSREAQRRLESDRPLPDEFEPEAVEEL